jgi:RNA polymerase sigma-70 factor (ECF subfamily)
MENDRKLFEELFRKNRDRVYRLCCLYTGDADQRKDLLQDIFIRVWESMGSFRGEAAMSTWMYRIALNTCLTHVRTLKRGLQTKSLPDGLDLVEELEPGRDEEPRLDYFISCVNQLPAFDRTLISLYLEDLPCKEIAQITGISEGNVRVKIHRIKEQLAQMITVLQQKNVPHEF